MSPIIIVGTGLGGYTVARELRKLDQDIPLLMITADDGEFYSKPMLSNAFASGKTAATLANATAAQMAAQLKAQIRTRSRLARIDPANKTIQVDGENLGYARLVLAMGADPIRLPLEGNGANEVLSVNDLQDYGRFREVVAGRHGVAIMGAGLIGCEFANDLLGNGYAVDVIDPAPQPLGRLLPPEAGEALQRALAVEGARWHLGQVVKRIDHLDHGYRLSLSDGSDLTADAVLAAIGLRPRIAIAQAAGLETHRGIVVDRALMSSASDVYAIGDCAEVGGLVLPFVMPIMHAGRALAKTLAGETTQLTYPAMPVVVKTPAWPTVVAPPPVGVDGQWEVSGTERGVGALYREAEGTLRGFALSGEAVAEKNALARELPPLLS